MRVDVSQFEQLLTERGWKHRAVTRSWTFRNQEIPDETLVSFATRAFLTLDGFRMAVIILEEAAK